MLLVEDLLLRQAYEKVAELEQGDGLNGWPGPPGQPKGASIYRSYRGTT